HVCVEDAQAMNALADGRAEAGNVAEDDQQEQREADAPDEPAPLAAEQLQLGDSEPAQRGPSRAGGSPRRHRRGGHRLSRTRHHRSPPLASFPSRWESWPVSATNASSRLAWSTRSCSATI